MEKETLRRKSSLLNFRAALKNSFRTSSNNNHQNEGKLSLETTKNFASPMTGSSMSAGTLDKDVPISPLVLTSKIPSSPEPIDMNGTNVQQQQDVLFKTKLKSDSQKKKENGTTPRNRASSRSNRRRVVQVDEAEKKNLLTRLRASLMGIESSLNLTEKDLETHLEENDFVLDKAATDFLERSGLRVIEPNQTLKKVLMEEDTPYVKNSWSNCDPTVFSVRYGPQYRISKIKAPAKPQTLYDMVAVDVFTSAEKVEHMSRYMRLGDMESSEHQSPLPSLFIVNFMLPATEPKIFSGEANGPTIHFHFIMKLSEWAKQNPNHPSVQLAARFINESGPNGSMRERLKLIVQVANPDEMDLGKIERGLCNKYNGLPFLYRTYNSRYHRGYGWFQADFDGHKSGYATRFARYSLLGWCQKIVANIGILVESETDEEMPERLLGCCNVHRLDCLNAKEFFKPMATPIVPRTMWREPAGSLLSEGSEPDRRGKSNGSFLEDLDGYSDALTGEEVNDNQIDKM